MEGNDYLPKVRGCNIRRLWRRYCTVQSPVSYAACRTKNVQARTIFLYGSTVNVQPPQ
jgi:hypothetical protein